MGGWKAFKDARLIHAAGGVTEAVYEPPILKGKLIEGGKQFLAGLKLPSLLEVENLCRCRDSRLRGIICAHSLAVGLQVINRASKFRPAHRQDSRQSRESKPMKNRLSNSCWRARCATWKQEFAFISQPNVANFAKSPNARPIVAMRICREQGEGRPSG